MEEVFKKRKNRGNEISGQSDVVCLWMRNGRDVCRCVQVDVNE